MPRAKSKTTMAPGMESIGHWVFLLGVFIAIVAGFLAGMNATIIWVIAILGLLVGLLNLKTPTITGKIGPYGESASVTWGMKQDPL